MKMITLKNDFHGSTVAVRGTLDKDEMGRPAVRISQRSYDRANKILCGINGCCCDSHGPTFVPVGNPSESTDWLVCGDVKK